MPESKKHLIASFELLIIGSPIILNDEFKMIHSPVKLPNSGVAGLS